MEARPVLVGTAGWSIASRHGSHFPAQGSHLERYAARLSCVEINSSFYRPHRRETYERWAASVPDGFRFSVKLPRTITHERRLKDCGPALDEFLEGARGLGRKLGVVLVQMPPSLRFDRTVAEAFLGLLRDKAGAGVVCEPRHASWFGPEPEALLKDLGAARAAVDPQPHPDAASPGGWRGLAYFRMHGSPHIYHSDYSAAALAALEQELRAGRRAGAESWCIFDNTAEGHALANAVTLDAALGHMPQVQAGAPEAGEQDYRG